jgi:His/Glu/Gln/Arg/opine family amino acid ABC transporter permease subunit
MIQDFEWYDVIIIMRALDWTLGLAIGAVLGGSILGLPIAVMRASTNGLLRVTALAYVVVFQGTPLLVQLLLAFFGASMLGFNVSPWVAAIVALCLNSAALLGETWRGCIQAVPRGQTAAGTALGLTRFNSFKWYPCTSHQEHICHVHYRHGRNYPCGANPDGNNLRAFVGVRNRGCYLFPYVLALVSYQRQARSDCECKRRPSSVSAQEEPQSCSQCSPGSRLK